MVSTEKLSLFNIEVFRKMYDENEDSYICDKSFFEIYDNESFIVKYIIRRQVKLLKFGDKYIGYVWHEYPMTSNQARIYAFELKEEYLNYLSKDVLSFLKCNTLIYDIYENEKHNKIMSKLDFNIQLKTLLMNLPVKDIEFLNYNIETKIENNNISFKKFRCNKDEELRCDVQNSIFKDKNRITIKVDDIYEEEREDYFLEDLCIFLNNSKGQSIGYGQVILYKGLYTIANFGIIKEYRGNGYGELLLNYLLQLCKNRSIKKVYIRVEKNNLKALSLYKKVGFEVCNSYLTYVGNLL